MSINRGMGTEDVVIYTMEFYSAIKKKETFATTWMEFETVIVSW